MSDIQPPLKELPNSEKLLELKDWMKFIGGSDRLDKDYTRIGSFKIDKDNPELLELQLDEVVGNMGQIYVYRRDHQCFCTKHVMYFYMLKRKGYYGQEYPLIVVGSKCYERFYEKRDDGKKRCFTICRYCKESLASKKKRKVCRDCTCIEDMGIIKLPQGKHKGKALIDVYDNHPEYCKFIVENVSQYKPWEELCEYVKLRNLIDEKDKNTAVKAVKKNILPPMTLKQLKTCNLFLKEKDFGISNI